MYNKFHVTELVEPFRTLPMSSGEYHPDVPCLGEHLKSISREWSPPLFIVEDASCRGAERGLVWVLDKGIDWLLDLYELPFVPSMFLSEKKIVYLNFLGASRVVMYRILD